MGGGRDSLDLTGLNLTDFTYSTSAAWEAREGTAVAARGLVMRIA